VSLLRPPPPDQLVSGRNHAARAFTENLPRRHRPVTPMGDTYLRMKASGDVSQAAGSRRRTAEPASGASRQTSGRILIAEDERDVAELIRYTLTKEGYEVLLAPNGTDALRHARELRPDLVLLDLMIPQLNGWELCRRLKLDPVTRAIPVIMVTARTEEGDKVLGFELGADDYVTKPFSTRELVARIRAVVRRSKPVEPHEGKHRLKVGDLAIDRHRFEVRMSGQLVDLTPKEFELLATLVGEPGRVFGRDELLDLVWGQDGFVEPRTVDVHVARLRAKFTAASLPAPGIDTVRGVGYRFREPGREPS